MHRTIDTDRRETGQWNILAAGRHRDPFAFLGLHARGDSYVLRTFQPAAETVEVIDSQGQALAQMARVHADGGFEAQLPTNPRQYRLRLAYASGDSSDIEDPYRFAASLGALDLYLLGEGTHQRIYDALGAHIVELEGIGGVRFAVWAPNAHRVSVVGEFNDWDGRRHTMRFHPGTGVWELFVASLPPGSLYKYELLDARGHLLPLKNDPLGNFYTGPPGNASVVYTSRYEWNDDEWMAGRTDTPDLDRPISIYEVHAGSWRRRGDEGNRQFTYREMADELLAYVVDMGFTHIEFLPLNEHPFDGSWGYQPIGIYAATYRFGEPDDFRYFVDRCHARGVGVIVDWVPAHFPRDPHGLVRFDGTALYEHEDPRKGEHADWGTLVFNYGRREVVNYLIGSALYWIDEYHIDGLRVDAVASMLYLDYSRDVDEWIPNEFGGNENLEAVAFLRRLNEAVHAHGGETFAEESTSWPGVSRPTYTGGLGFTYKWNMGWMNDTLKYMSEQPIHRKHHHDSMTFGLVYAFNENFLLPLSHDEVVHGKRSLIGRMPGDEWQRFANLRAYYGAMFAYPGKKLLFMGNEFAQFDEWNHDQSLDWHLLGCEANRGVQTLIRDLNHLYRDTPALHEVDFESAGFEWIDWQDSDNSVLTWIRRARNGDFVVSVSNFTPVVRYHYRIGLPGGGRYTVCINTDAIEYGGSGAGVGDLLESEPLEYRGRPASLQLTLPPLATVILKPLAVGARE